MPPAVSTAALNIRAGAYMILHGFTQPSWVKYNKMLSNDEVCLHEVCANKKLGETALSETGHTRGAEEE